MHDALLGAVAGLRVGTYAPTIRRQLAEADRDPTPSADRAAAPRSSLFGLPAVGIVAVIFVMMAMKPSYAPISPAASASPAFSPDGAGRGSKSRAAELMQ